MRKLAIGVALAAGLGLALPVASPVNAQDTVVIKKRGGDDGFERRRTTKKVIVKKRYGDSARKKVIIKRRGDDNVGVRSRTVIKKRTYD